MSANAKPYILTCAVTVLQSGEIVDAHEVSQGFLTPPDCIAFSVDLWKKDEEQSVPL